ncbi:hypothetical protein [Burkholderia ambifaria]|uniref:hypothetical protein n=1 Tax=Burkholderia ambifaria TaxID=152480 RepID=UPI0012FDEFCA|nr:hypothetical protein [Burkholderia ambifaria]
MKITTSQDRHLPEPAAKNPPDNRPASSHHTRSAVLYRGCVTFAHANGPRNTTLTSADRSRLIRAVLARSRGAFAKSSHPEAASAGNAKADTDDIHDAFPLAADSGEDRDDQRQSHQFHMVHDLEAESTGQPGATGALDESECRIERQHTSATLRCPDRNGDAILETSIGKLLDLRDSIAVTPGRSIRAHVYTLLIDLIAVCRRPDSPCADSISKLNDTFRRVVAERTSADAAHGNRPAPHERVQHFNVLLGLLLLNTCRPSTAMQDERALSRLRALRRATSMFGSPAALVPLPASSRDGHDNGMHT